MAAADQWRWTDEDGVQRLLSGDELRAALGDGRLSPSTMVWRRGMAAWQPASEVAELNLEPDTITQQRSRSAPPPGAKIAPTPSIPPTPMRTPAGKPSPSNMVNIAALRAQAYGKRPRTMLGVGGQSAAAKPPDAKPVNIPSAPRVPSMGYRGGDADQAAAVIGTPRTRTPTLDGGWREGAARPDEEETVTRVRSDDDDGATLDGNTQKSQKKPPAAGRARSVPPPRKKRSVPPPRKAAPASTKTDVIDAKPKKSVPPPAKRKRSAAMKAARTLATARTKMESKAPPPVPSTEVLSEAFRSQAGAKATPTPGGVTPKPQDSLEVLQKQSDEALQRLVDADDDAPTLAGRGSSEIPAAQASRRPKMIPTAPLPKVRPKESSRPDPKFASEPWKGGDAAKTAPSPDALSSPPVAQSAPPAVEVNERSAPPAAPAGGVVAAQQQAALDAARTPVAAAPTKEITLRMPMVVASAAAAAALVIGAFFAGRLSAPANAGVAAAVQARSGWTAVPLFARTRSVGLEPRPCLMMRAPSRFAFGASKIIPLETKGTPEGKLAIGFARSITQARGMVVDPATGAADVTYEPDEGDEDLSRVVPLIKDGELTFASTLAEQGDVHNAIYVATKQPFVFGFTNDQAVKLPEPGADPQPLWAIESKGGRPDAPTASAIADKGVAITYRLAGQIYFGLLDDDGKVVHPGAVITGSGGKVGKPNVAANQHAMSVVFADKPAATAPAEIRWARGPIEKALKDGTPVDLPSGGPGGDAIAPAIAALSGGRWLLMWTEGRSGARVLRAQTYDHMYRPIGKALRVSPETGNFGQGTVAVVGESAVVAFLMATSQSYELWGTVLQCE